jgi:large subunit ribosomal protein L21
MIKGAKVMCEVVEHNRAAKVTAYKKKPRNTYRRKLGHRQHQTVVRITDIVAK